MYQLDSVKMTRAQFEKLPFRDDDKDGVHKEGQRYRTRDGYPDAYFEWVAYEKGADAKGEWNMGRVEFTD